MTEREIKFMIDGNGYLKAKAALEGACLDGRALFKGERVQVNYYYDTSDRALHREGITLRIRQSGGRLQGQIKTHDKGRTGNSEEYYFSVDTLPEKLVFRGRNVKLRGSLVTLRAEYQAEGREAGTKFTVDLDHDFYLGNEDYELEIEYPDGAEAEARAFAASLGVDFLNVKGGKYSRFLKALKRSSGASAELAEPEAGRREEKEI